MRDIEIDAFLHRYVLPDDHKVAYLELRNLIDEVYQDGREDERGRTWEL